MLTIGDRGGLLGRRDFLRIGSLGLGGLSLASLFGSRAAAADLSRPVTDKSVIFLFLHGGPTQTETFDPKMSAPEGIRSAVGEVKTSLPGVTFGASLPKIAKLAHRVAVVRSFVTGDGNHDIKPIVGKDTFGANLGSVFAQVAGSNHPTSGMPTNVALFPQAVEPMSKPANMSFGRFTDHGPFAGVTAPFVPGGGGQLQKDMKLTLPMDRIDDRRALLRQLDAAKSGLDRLQREGVEGMREKAFQLLLGTVAEAFDLSKEDAKTVERYDTAPLVRPENIDKKWRNYNNYVDNAKTLGKLLLMARRLCERGCGFVTVTTNFVWDMHADVNNATIEEGMRYMGAPFDHAVSAFLEDVAARSLSDRILLVCCGEMGRTPKINKNGGRDHWGNIAPLLLSGGGLKTGQVVGQSDRNAGEPATEPVRIKNLISTVLNTLFDVGKLRVVRGLAREIGQMAEADPIPNLHG